MMKRRNFIKGLLTAIASTRLPLKTGIDASAQSAIHYKVITPEYVAKNAKQILFYANLWMPPRKEKGRMDDICKPK